MNITVFITNHNYGKYLQNSIDSVFKQTYPKNKLRLLIVDDGSTDNSKEVIHKLFKSVPHEKKQNRHDVIGVTQEKVGVVDGVKCHTILIEKNHGQSWAFDVGLEASLDYTDIYCILDSDDEMYPNKVERCAIEFTQSLNIGVVYGDYDILNVELGTVTREYKEVYDRQRLHQDCMVHSCALVRKEAYLSVLNYQNEGFYDKEIRGAKDYDMWLRISDKFGMIHVAEPLTLVRVHPVNLSKQNDVFVKDIQRIQQKRSGV